MKIRFHSLLAAAGLLLATAGAGAQQTRITPKDLTLDEKIHLLSVDMGIPRLGVPTSFYSEGMHGIAYGGPAPWGNVHKPLPTTSFPQAYGLAQTWDPALMEKVAAQISLEQRWYFQNPETDRGGLIIWGPNVDLGRDPRWGRTEECYGEDPWLIAEMAKAYVRGAQGPDPDHWSSACVLKHFCPTCAGFNLKYRGDIRRRDKRKCGMHLVEAHVAAQFQIKLLAGQKAPLSGDEAEYADRAMSALSILDHLANAVERPYC